MSNVERFTNLNVNDDGQKRNRITPKSLNYILSDQFKFEIKADKIVLEDMKNGASCKFTLRGFQQFIGFLCENQSEINSNGMIDIVYYTCDGIPIHMWRDKSLLLYENDENEEVNHLFVGAVIIPYKAVNKLNMKSLCSLLTSIN